ncbi:response regulator transcription factor [Aliiglaciecola litoralis]|uniref:Response regulator transcription factor n=1 Tax=Aliiglaciecola litoralis TaxID=582857 RepID=A0ABP3WRP7_9ALTE
MIKVMVVDDQTLVREGIKSLLMLSPELSIVAEAMDGEIALQEIRKHQPDVVLMDIRMPVKNGIEAVRELNASANDACPPVIMLTTFDDHQMVLEALKVGAKGYLLKDVSLETLVDAIKTVYSGQTLIQPCVTERVLQKIQSHSNEFESEHQPEPLTIKEAEILRLMASGCSNREIAQAMFKSEGTVKNQVSTILAKLGVRDRTRAVLKAIDMGII